MSRFRYWLIRKLVPDGWTVIDLREERAVAKADKRVASNQDDVPAKRPQIAADFNLTDELGGF